MLFTAGAIKMAVDVLSGGVGATSGAALDSSGSSDTPPNQSRGIIKSSLDAGKKIKDMAGYGKQLVNKRLGVLGINLSLGAILKQSQIFTGVMGSLFQILGAFVDIALAPLMPLFARGLQALAGKIPAMFELVDKVETYIKSIWAEAGGDWAAFIGLLIGRTLSNATSAVFTDLWEKSVASPNFWLEVLQMSSPQAVLMSIIQSEVVRKMWKGFVDGLGDKFKNWLDQNFLITPFIELIDSIKKTLSNLIIAIKEKLGIDTTSDVQKMINARPRISIGSQEMEEFGSPYGPNSGFNRGRVTDPALNMYNPDPDLLDKLKDVADKLVSHPLVDMIPNPVRTVRDTLRIAIQTGPELYETVYDFADKTRKQDTIDFFVNPFGLKSYFDDTIDQMRGFLD